MQFTHGGLWNALEFFPKEVSPEGVPLLGAKFLLGSLLEMGGLGGDEERIEFGFKIGGEEVEIGRKAQKAEEVERLF